MKYKLRGIHRDTDAKEVVAGEERHLISGTSASIRTRSTIIFCLFCCLALSAYGQQQPNQERQPPLHIDLVKTVGFCMGQRFSLERISAMVPDAADDARIAQLEWEALFKGAEINIINELKHLLGNKWDDIRTAIVEKAKEQISRNPISVEHAYDIIDTVRGRTAGNTELAPPPILETLLTYHPVFHEFPSEEFHQGFKTVLLSEGAGKAKGLKFRIEFPRSWKPREGKRPHIIKSYKSKNGRGFVAATVFVRDMAQGLKDELTKSDILALKNGELDSGLTEMMFSESNLMKVVADQKKCEEHSRGVHSPHSY